MRWCSTSASEGSPRVGAAARSGRHSPRRGEFVGTPLYASPEQLAGEVGDARALDLYAWGLIFLECLTGRHPFAEAGAAARLPDGGRRSRSRSGCGTTGSGSCSQKVTAREAAKRDVSVEALIEALEEIAGGGELPVAPETLPDAPRRSRTQRRAAAPDGDVLRSGGLDVALSHSSSTAEAYRRIVQAYQARAARRSSATTGTWSSTWATACWSTSATRRPTRTTPSGRCVRDARCCARSRDCSTRASSAEHGVRSRRAWASTPAPSWSARWAAARRRRRWRSATRRTSRRGWRASPSRARW